MMERGSGILQHITSLPSPFGIGDLGPSAFRFADFLSAAGQKYWQILPINPTNPACSHSPYLSSSAFAGNTLLISPELMIRNGFLGDMGTGPVPDFPEDRVDYAQVLLYKRCLLDRAFAESGNEVREDKNFLEFCRRNAWWLDDFALFAALADSYGGTAWNTWPDPVRFRTRDELDRLSGKFNCTIEREKFLQYVFFSQWENLHRYCRERDIRIIGDMPMYLHYNSADVWVHPELFLLDDSHLPTVVAGVPPDYFSRTGQLWNNPLYRWQEHERTGFSWWILRFRHALSLFDRVRIDHFRGLIAFYEIPAGAKTATGGRWADAPDRKFLRVMNDTFPDFPVIAEDLGVITPDVRGIMKEFGLPGMRVLEFAFTSDLPGNDHAPHNLSRNVYLYTGTH
ncbi:MAG TPA: 4-alpha-glucanotransferase, partial [Methanoregula sp.]|nr:4-alpha-glucanotransferase [Methanoregula sp.]